ncbi:RCC1 domain-containing protein, partial [Deinococcus marmoris]
MQATRLITRPIRFTCGMLLCAALLTACPGTTNTPPPAGPTVESIALSAVVKRPGSDPMTFEVVGNTSLPVYFDLEARDAADKALPATMLSDLKPCYDPAKIRLSDISAAPHPHRLRVQVLAQGQHTVTFVRGVDCKATGVTVTLKGTALRQRNTLQSGSDYSLALKADGTVTAWGYNGGGQLGNGSTVDSTVPVAVGGLRNVVAVTAGS